MFIALETINSLSIFQSQIRQFSSGERSRELDGVVKDFVIVRKGWSEFPTLAPYGSARGYNLTINYPLDQDKRISLHTTCLQTGLWLPGDRPG